MLNHGYCERKKNKTIKIKDERDEVRKGQNWPCNAYEVDRTMVFQWKYELSWPSQLIWRNNSIIKKKTNYFQPNMTGITIPVSTGQIQIFEELWIVVNEGDPFCFLATKKMEKQSLSVSYNAFWEGKENKSLPILNCVNVTLNKV